ncbi:HD domain-containing protein [Nitratidesulfovibrio sp.]|uniref:HD domain-containing protein n=1 Tax=Nitratidesulfovibrio sp. TaxID=2802297 RepID=UPI003342C019
MSQPFKDAIAICKAILRNGYDAYVVNAQLQKELLDGRETEIDIACEPDYEELGKLFPSLERSNEEGVVATMREGGALIRFYHTDTEESSHPEHTLARITPRMLRVLEEQGKMPPALSCPFIAHTGDAYEGFEDFSKGKVQLRGIPDETLRRNYLLVIRAMRFAANFDLPIEPNSWMAIIRAASRVLDYVRISDIMDEWRKVEAECMWKFVQLLFDSQVLHGLLPEVAALSRVRQQRNDDGAEETVFDHTIECVRHYPEGEYNYDWLGTFAMLFHDVGKLYTAEYFDGKWNFYQHHRVGAKVTRKLLRRLHFSPEDVEQVCHLVRHHMRFHFMLTDRGIRRFKSLDEFPRLIEMARADLEARAGSYTYFNHNMKYLERAETPEQMLEPLLNGNEIMEFTNLHPGPQVGMLRDALLKAQVAGEVTSVPEAVDYVREYKAKNFG